MFVCFQAAILQQTSEYITNLESEKTRLLSQNSILRHTLKELNHNPDTLVGSLAEQITPQPATAPPAAKRKKRDTESSDEGISLGFDEVQIDELRKEVVELRLQLERERKLRQALENRGIPPPSANPPVVKTDLLPKREPATSPPPPAVQTTPAKVRHFHVYWPLLKLPCFWFVQFLASLRLLCIGGQVVNLWGHFGVSKRGVCRGG